MTLAFDGEDAALSAESWLRQQLDHALWQKKQKGDHPIRKPAVT